MGYLCLIILTKWCEPHQKAVKNARTLHKIRENCYLMEKSLVSTEKKTEKRKCKVRIWVKCEYCDKRDVYGECVCEGTRFLEDITHILNEES